MTRFFRIEYEGRPRHVVAHDRAGGCSKAISSASTRRATRSPSTGHRLLAPVEPSKIVAVGLNYKDHAAEQNKPLPAEPMIFIKPSTAVIGPGDPIVLPAGVGRVDHEAEVGVVIGARASQVPRGRGARLHPRHHVRQRRHGARAAEEGHPVHAREGVRHLRARSGPASRRGWSTTRRTAWRSRDGSTGRAASRLRRAS